MIALSSNSSLNTPTRYSLAQTCLSYYIIIARQLARHAIVIKRFLKPGTHLNAPTRCTAKRDSVVSDISSWPWLARRIVKIYSRKDIFARPTSGDARSAFASTRLHLGRPRSKLNLLEVTK